MTERSGALQEDSLYMSYANVVAKSCGEEEEDAGGEESDVSVQVSGKIHLPIK